MLMIATNDESEALNKNAIDIEKYLDDIELVVVGGESDYNARPFDYSWALSIREQCIRKNVSFEFRQCGGIHCIFSLLSVHHFHTF